MNAFLMMMKYIVWLKINKLIDKLYNRIYTETRKRYIRHIYKIEYERREQIRNSYTNKRNRYQR